MGLGFVVPVISYGEGQYELPEGSLPLSREKMPDAETGDIETFIDALTSAGKCTALGQEIHDVRREHKVAGDEALLVAGEAAMLVANTEAMLSIAKELLRRFYYPAAFTVLLHSASLGEGVSPLLIGGLYYQGLGVYRDRPEAYKWWRRAEKQNVECAAPARRTLAQKLGDGLVMLLDNLAKYRPLIDVDVSL